MSSQVQCGLLSVTYGPSVKLTIVITVSANPFRLLMLTTPSILTPAKTGGKRTIRPSLFVMDTQLAW